MKKILAIVMILAVVAALAAPLTALADGTGIGSTEINASVAPALELVAPTGAGTNGALDLGALKIGANGLFTTTAGIVECNSSTGYNVTVASSNHEGKMVSGSWILGSALSVTTGSLTAKTVTDEAQKCVTSNTPGTSPIDLSVSQAIGFSDAAVTAYGITLTYTATVGP